MKIYAHTDHDRERVYKYELDGNSYFTILKPSDVPYFEDTYGVRLHFWRECDKED